MSKLDYSKWDKAECSDDEEEDPIPSACKQEENPGEGDEDAVPVPALVGRRQSDDKDDDVPA